MRSEGKDAPDGGVGHQKVRRHLEQVGVRCQEVEFELILEHLNFGLVHLFHSNCAGLVFRYKSAPVQDIENQSFVLAIIFPIEQMRGSFFVINIQCSTTYGLDTI